VVHVSTMRYSNDGHDTYDIVYLVKDSVRADSCRIGARELVAQWLADPMRVLRKGTGNEGNHCVKRLGWQFVQIALSRRTNLDPVTQRGFVVRKARYSSMAIPRSPRAVAMSLPMSGMDRQNAVSSMASHSSAEMITAVARPFFVISTCSSKVSTSLMSALKDCRASASVTDFMYRILATFARAVVRPAYRYSATLVEEELIDRDELPMVAQLMVTSPSNRALVLAVTARATNS
jgi:hypothetical protein